MSNSNGSSRNGKSISQEDQLKASLGRWFKFHPKLVTSGLLTRTRALFLCDLMHLARWCKETGRIKPGGWFPCSESWLRRSLGWTTTAQGRMLAALKKKKLLSCKKIKHGQLQRPIRHVCLHLDVLRQSLAERDRPTTQQPRTLSYAEYLQTDHWQYLRREMLRQADYRCQLCYADGELHVHHRTYDRLGCERLTDLTVLCKACHDKHHDVLPQEGGDE